MTIQTDQQCQREGAFAVFKVEIYRVWYSFGLEQSTFGLEQSTYEDLGFSVRMNWSSNLSSNTSLKNELDNT